MRRKQVTPISIRPFSEVNVPMVNLRNLVLIDCLNY